MIWILIFTNLYKLKLITYTFLRSIQICVKSTYKLLVVGLIIVVTVLTICSDLFHDLGVSSLLAAQHTTPHLHTSALYEPIATFSWIYSCTNYQSLWAKNIEKIVKLSQEAKLKMLKQFSFFGEQKRNPTEPNWRWKENGLA